MREVFSQLNCRASETVTVFRKLDEGPSPTIKKRKEGSIKNVFLHPPTRTSPTGPLARHECRVVEGGRRQDLPLVGHEEIHGIHAC